MSVFVVRLNNYGTGFQGNLDVIANDVGATGTPPGGAEIGSTGLGITVTTSLQRTVYVMGPRKINRELKDGMTFTDCNYWKRFATVANGGLQPNYVPSGPNGTQLVPNDTCFIYVQTDDGTFWSDDQRENAFPVSRNYTLTGSDVWNGNNQTLVTNSQYWGQTNASGACINGSVENFNATTNSYAQANCWYFLLNYGTPATFVEIYNRASSTSTSCMAYINCSAAAVTGGSAVGAVTTSGASFTVPGGASWVFNQQDCQITSIALAASSSGESSFNVDVVAGVTTYPQS